MHCRTVSRPIPLICSASQVSPPQFLMPFGGEQEQPLGGQTHVSTQAQNQRPALRDCGGETVTRGSDIIPSSQSHPSAPGSCEMLHQPSTTRVAVAAMTSRVAVCGSNGSTLNHATAPNEPQAAPPGGGFPSARKRAPLSHPPLKRCPEFTREPQVRGLPKGHSDDIRGLTLAVRLYSDNTAAPHSCTLGADELSSSASSGSPYTSASVVRPSGSRESPLHSTWGWG